MDHSQVGSKAEQKRKMLAFEVNANGKVNINQLYNYNLSLNHFNSKLTGGNLTKMLLQSSKTDSLPL